MNALLNTETHKNKFLIANSLHNKENSRFETPMKLCISLCPIITLNKHFAGKQKIKLHDFESKIDQLYYYLTADTLRIPLIIHLNA